MSGTPGETARAAEDARLRLKRRMAASPTELEPSYGRGLKTADWTGSATDVQSKKRARRATTDTDGRRGLRDGDEDRAAVGGRRREPGASLV